MAAARGGQVQKSKRTTEPGSGRVSARPGLTVQVATAVSVTVWRRVTCTSRPGFQWKLTCTYKSLISLLRLSLLQLGHIMVVY